MSLNSVNIMGNLTRDPELKYTPSGKIRLQPLARQQPGVHQKRREDDGGVLFRRGGLGARPRRTVPNT